ncbi:MAG: hypothetical protein MZV63_36505 [Marinilabiliales bacterium]|nr:hypothetical protein [Marinilabiliales bacterium]
MILSRVDTVGATATDYLAGVAAASSSPQVSDMQIAAQIGSFVAGVTVQKLFRQALPHLEK